LQLNANVSELFIKTNRLQHRWINYTTVILPGLNTWIQRITRRTLGIRMLTILVPMGKRVIVYPENQITTFLRGRHLYLSSFNRGYPSVDHAGGLHDNHLVFGSSIPKRNTFSSNRNQNIPFSNSSTSSKGPARPSFDRRLGRSWMQKQLYPKNRSKHVSNIHSKHGKKSFFFTETTNDPCSLCPLNSSVSLSK